MPRRTDIKSILIPGSGPIIIGQACEFDYSGTQACKALRKEGYRIILHNSNPATIMTDPELADATYIEPLTIEFAEKIIALERPDALLPTVGGQTALNLCMSLHEKGILKKYNVELLGVNVESIHKAESRQEFKKAIEKLGLHVPASCFCNNLRDALNFLKTHSLPLIIRPSFTLGGTGGGIARTEEELEKIVISGLDASPVKEVLIEESVIGWKEYELELMRDIADNVVVICSIENIDAMGVHTGDSITVAPQQTLSDVQYQIMRNAAISIIREIGVATGGSNIQFAVNPKNGDMIVIEMNPRVSRSSALASKATGFPIAKIAALLAVGYTLDELKNDITKVTPCSFEPALDYVVTKMPRFAFEKFPGSDDTLGTMMRSVGECMSMGRTFKESFQKATRSLEIGRFGLGADGNWNALIEQSIQIKRDKRAYYKRIQDSLSRPNPYRIFDIKIALECAVRDSESPFSVERVSEWSGVDPWFLVQFLDLVYFEIEVEKNLLSKVSQEKVVNSIESQTAKFMELASTTENPTSSIFEVNMEILKRAKEYGYTDRQLAYLVHKKEIESLLDEVGVDIKLDMKELREKIQTLMKNTEVALTQFRYREKILPVYKRVDTCAGEFESHTPYLYSSYEEEDESQVQNEKKKILILGGGPNRIGQGIEFDYCCCHASFALQAIGLESIMVNSNPETVSTDYDISDKLYFEPLTIEDVLHICEKEKPDGLIISFGGQTPLGLSRALEYAGQKIMGTQPEAIDRAEDRDRFSHILRKLNLKQASSGFAHNLDEAKKLIERISYPVLLRPSYVLGGRAMVIVNHENELEHFMKEAIKVSPEYPVFIDHFLENAQEIDVDALSDGVDVFIAGIMQHIEEAGIHSGDSACILPAQNLSLELIEEIKEATKKLALELGVRGLLNIQYAFCENELYVIEVNPRASRTIPFVSKVIGVPLVRLATKIMCKEFLGEEEKKKIETCIQELNASQKNLNEQGAKYLKTVAVKEAVLPFSRFPGTDILLGPEMKSTGEVMGIGLNLGQAYIKAQLSTGERIPISGGVFFSVHDAAKEILLEDVRELIALGYKLYSTSGTATFLEKNQIEVKKLEKLSTQLSPNPLELIQSGEINFIINIPTFSNTHEKKKRETSLGIDSNTSPSTSSIDDAILIRQEATRRRILCVTTIAGIKALILGLKELSQGRLDILSLQELHKKTL